VEALGDLHVRWTGGDGSLAADADARAGAEWDAARVLWSRRERP
jgi:hypothetical protein